MTTGTERRKFARLDLALNVSYRVVGVTPQPDDPTDTLSADVSLGGLRLMTPGPLANGVQLEVAIDIGDEQPPVIAQAEVAWQSKISATSYETGVTIKGMDEKNRSRFMSFVFDQMSKVGA